MNSLITVIARQVEIYQGVVMPIYEFECCRCSHVYERVMKVDESYDDLACPECGAAGPKKLATAFRTNNWSTFLDGMEKRVNPHKFK
jgi:putative FmdB family regulatory protein